MSNLHCIQSPEHEVEADPVGSPWEDQDRDVGCRVDDLSRVPVETEENAGQREEEDKHCSHKHICMIIMVNIRYTKYS